MLLKKSLTFLFIGTIFIGPFFDLNGLYIYHLLLPLMMFHLAANSSFKIKKLNISIIFFLIAWPLTTLAWVNDLTQGFKSLSHISIFAVNVIIISKLFETDRKVLHASIIFFFLLNLLLGYAEFFDLYQRTDLYDLELGKLSLEKSRGFQFNPNNFSLSLVLFTPFLLDKYQNSSKRWLLVLFAVFIILLFNGSRSATLSYILIISLSFEILRSSKTISSSQLFWGLSLLGIGVIFAIYFNNNQLVARSLNVVSIIQTAQVGELTDGGSTATRFLKYIGVSQAFFDNRFITGLGIGGSYQYGFGAPHLGLFQYFFELGPLILLPVLFFISQFKKIKVINSFDRNLRNTAYIILISSLSVSSVYYFLPFHLFFGYLTGYLKSRMQTSRNTKV